MPSSGNCHSFDSSTLKALNSIGAVYGLFKTDLHSAPTTTPVYVWEKPTT
jgi:hypothetical protein